VAVETQSDLTVSVGELNSLDVLAAVSQPGQTHVVEYNLESGITVAMLNGGELASHETVASKTDVLPGKYEGGFKIWECSFDAIKHIDKGAEPKMMLDLGCGSGIVGIWALKRWPNLKVAFHDLNRSVLEKATIPNLVRNGSVLVDRTKFYFGPWELSSETLLFNGQFDLVSTADTLYDPEAISQLHNVLVRIIEPGGKAIISAKRFYFGVGGGVASFMNIVRDRRSGRVSIVASYEDGSSNIRDVFEFYPGQS